VWYEGIIEHIFMLLNWFSHDSKEIMMVLYIRIDAVFTQ